MIKRLLTIIFVSLMMLGIPAASQARTVVEVIENDLQEITITISSSVLHVTGAHGMTLDIYNVAGMKVMSLKVDSSDRRYELSLPKGCYIVKVGKTVRKISIR